MKSEQSGQEKKQVNYIGIGFVLGLAIGVAWGVALSAATDSPAFISIGIGGGMCIGIAIGSSLQRRHEQEEGAAPANDAGEEGPKQE